MSVNLKSLFGRLNDTCQGALQGATGLCVSRTNYDIELEHFLMKLGETPDTDVAKILPHFEIAPPRVLKGQSLRRAQTALAEHLFYPPQAVAQGLEGDVILLLTLSENGQLVSASIARGSGHALLDQAALDAARRLGALPGNPRQTLFPVRFSLQ